MDDVLRDAAARAIRYRQEVANRPVWPTPAALDALGRLDEALPPTRQNDAAVLALLDDMASPATVATSGGRYFGFVVGSSLPATLAANWLELWQPRATGRAKTHYRTFWTTHYLRRTNRRPQFHHGLIEVPRLLRIQQL